MPSILITGCSSGIGYNTAKFLHQMGWRVFASCRKAEDVERLKAEGFADALQLDVADSDSINANCSCGRCRTCRLRLLS